MFSAPTSWKHLSFKRLPKPTKPQLFISYTFTEHLLPASPSARWLVFSWLGHWLGQRGHVFDYITIMLIWHFHGLLFFLFCVSL